MRSVFDEIISRLRWALIHVIVNEYFQIERCGRFQCCGKINTEYERYLRGVRILKQVVMAATNEQGVTHGYP
jgi:hypothetical protein